ncbi:lipoprotein insertase outer membrane protein LolB [Shewanella gaetbuli]|uniref:Outer-membrane lipoprotein LolB n=1 Tax=Shewanella gaetbuli TaxID=220752 RepID=A0A9X2CGX8_9GAMM|nr:lipoprotein insertase outer membrane protein LolB [Shewanella gaetbuli]MCL1141377.1 lipoprotein insertase outer membrane protein LolB [Shewanella gaetbuli]
MPRFNQIKSAIAFTLLLLLSACTSLPTQEYQPTNVTSVSDASHWELQGKIAVKSSTDKFSTNLYWFHHTKGNELRLTTPLGTNVLTLKDDQGIAELNVDGKNYQDTNPQALLSSVSGITIPFDDIPLWLTGRVSSNDNVISYNKDGKILSFTSPDPQADWQVSFISWQQQSGVEVPRLLKIERQDVQIRIQSNIWQALTTKSN